MSKKEKKKQASRKKPAATAKQVDAAVSAVGRLRTWIIMLVLVALPLALFWHLAHLQVVPSTEKGYEFLQAQGEARTLRTEKLNAYRGIITDRNGEILAVSTPVKSIVLDPQKFDGQRLPELAEKLGVADKTLALKISRFADKQFMYLARHLPPNEADAILALKVRGVRAEEEFQRYYPAGEVAAHVVGFTDIDEMGQEGMELALNEWLSGAPGHKQVIKDLKGNVVKDLGVIQAPSSGNDVRLTIDLRLQYLAYRELKSAVIEQGAKSGSLVMLDANTGEILAMANQPSFNPNNRAGVEPDQLRNRAITDLVEPGSTVKPFTVLAALETGRYHPKTKINTAPGYIRVAGKTYSDFKNYGLMDLTTILKKSSQVGISKISLDLDVEHMRDTLFRAGLGQAPGTGFPGEAVGVLPDRVRWHLTEQVALGFGHGLSVTALQLAQAYVSLASGGIFHSATLLPKKPDVRGTRIYQEKHAQQVIQMMSHVTESGGTATRAKLDSYLVAGKTGTAHKVKGSGYADDKYVALFTGMVPAEAPEIVIAVIVNEPPVERYYGGEAAAPVFRRVANSALRLLNVPPQGLASR